MLQSFDANFYRRRNEEVQSYTKEHFEVSGFMNDKYKSIDTNAVSRMRNLMVGALHDRVVFPKYIVVVMDDDLVEFVAEKNLEAGTKTFTRLLNWLMRQYSRIIETQKEFLPGKAKRLDHPWVIWIEPTLHDNFPNNETRFCFIQAMNDAAKKYSNFTVLKLKKVWDPQDSNLYLRDTPRFTTQGYNAYWDAVDKTVKYVDTILTKKWKKKPMVKVVKIRDNDASKEAGLENATWSRADL